MVGNMLDKHRRLSPTRVSLVESHGGLLACALSHLPPRLDSNNCTAATLHSNLIDGWTRRYANEFFRRRHRVMSSADTRMLFPIFESVFHRMRCTSNVARSSTTTTTAPWSWRRTCRRRPVPSSSRPWPPPVKPCTCAAGNSMPPRRPRPLEKTPRSRPRTRACIYHRARRKASPTTPTPLGGLGIPMKSKAIPRAPLRGQA